MDTLFTQQSNHGIMGEGKQEDDGDDLDSISSYSSSSSSSSNGSSNSSDFHEDATSSSSSSVDGPLYEMSSLMQQLPFKRGLSKHFQGKSQSFTSLSNVRCLEDLAKPEHNPCKKKKLKSCKSYAGGFSEGISPPKTLSKTITKNKAGSGSGSSSTWTSSLSAAKRSHSFRPPVPPPQRSSNLFNQTPLFA